MISIGPESAISSTIDQSAISNSLRIPFRVLRQVGEPGLEKGVVTLAALAARPAMNEVKVLSRFSNLLEPSLSGLMHDSVSWSGTPRATPRVMTSGFVASANGASMASGCARPSDSAPAIADRNAGVASGKGLWARVPSTSRSMPAAAQYTAAFPSSTMFRPGKYTSSSGVW